MIEPDPLWTALRAHGRRLMPRDPILYAAFRDGILPLAWANLVNRTRLAALEDVAKRLAALDGAEDLEGELSDLVDEAKGLVP
jgi:hypothetical protein